MLAVYQRGEALFFARAGACLRCSKARSIARFLFSRARFSMAAYAHRHSHEGRAHEGRAKDASGLGSADTPVPLASGRSGRHGPLHRLRRAGVVDGRAPLAKQADPAFIEDCRDEYPKADANVGFAEVSARHIKPVSARWCGTARARRSHRQAASFGSI
jgi:hypothetical protein